MADALLLADQSPSRNSNARSERGAHADGSGKECSALAARLSLDPLLTLWCFAAAANGPQQNELRTAEEIGDWFVAHAAERLNGRGLVDDESSVVDYRDALSMAARVVERAATLAHLSTAVARAEDDRAANSRRSSRLPDEAAHWARLYIGMSWCQRALDTSLSTCQSQAQQFLSQLPSRLTEHFGTPTLNYQAGNRPAALACVAQALQRLASADWTTSADDFAVAMAVAYGQAVGRQWIASADAIDCAAAGDSLRELIARLSRLAELKASFTAVLEREKLTALAEFAGGAGHEINNPLAVISGRAQLLLTGERDPQRRRELAVIAAQALRIHEMIADLMLFARPPEPRLATCDLGDLVERVLETFRAEARHRDVQLVLNRPPRPVAVHADATQISVAVAALLRNSFEAMVGAGRIKVSVDWHGPLTARRAEIVVTDDGPGLPDEVRRHLFDPYFSGRTAGRGLGLGLSKCWRIMHAHGGNVEVASEPGGGARFRLLLPASELPDGDAQGAEEASDSTSNTSCVFHRL
jgi:signal transduction histidine kinase